mmetsp:Transcript_8390/g.23546  ORF Transcript_8390/g.23546 Transcript_8390/m.23546 type:complete len:334 (+) Transcript_8390:504-1505(+)
MGPGVHDGHSVGHGELNSQILQLSVLVQLKLLRVQGLSSQGLRRSVAQKNVRLRLLFRRLRGARLQRREVGFRPAAHLVGLEATSQLLCVLARHARVARPAALERERRGAVAQTAVSFGVEVVHGAPQRGDPLQGIVQQVRKAVAGGAPLPVVVHGSAALLARDRRAHETRLAPAFPEQPEEVLLRLGVQRLGAGGHPAEKATGLAPVQRARALRAEVTGALVDRLHLGQARAAGHLAARGARGASPPQARCPGLGAGRRGPRRGPGRRQVKQHAHALRAGCPGPGTGRRGQRSAPGRREFAHHACPARRDPQSTLPWRARPGPASFAWDELT